jgi:hypothetical protein
VRIEFIIMALFLFLMFFETRFEWRFCFSMFLFSSFFKVLMICFILCFPFSWFDTCVIFEKCLFFNQMVLVLCSYSERMDWTVFWKSCCSRKKNLFLSKISFMDSCWECFLFLCHVLDHFAYFVSWVGCF